MQKDFFILLKDKISSVFPVVIGTDVEFFRGEES